MSEAVEIVVLSVGGIVIVGGIILGMLFVLEWLSTIFEDRRRPHDG